MTTVAISSTNDKSSDASLESIFNSEIRFATEKKNPLRIASKRVSSTQSRGRTGTGRPTGV